ncbi:MAG: cytochrome c [Thermoleophilia bacterium]|nr:cytochrome c [Thermoleophilia bacterium]
MAQTGDSAPPAETAAPETGGDSAAGRDVFLDAGCAGCHTLADAGAAGAVGPSLDAAKPAAALVVDVVTNGRGAMPAFPQLSGQEIADVAAYVAAATAG